MFDGLSPANGMTEEEPDVTKTGRGVDTVVFDLGGVVLQWAPERAFGQVLPPPEVPAFMAEINFADWNRQQDSGRDWQVAEDELIRRQPRHGTAIRAYRRYFDHALPGYVPGTGAIMAELAQAGVRLLALTNWSAELFPHARRRFGLLDRFEQIMVSGEEGRVKPDPLIFQSLCQRYRLRAGTAIFIDDSAVNCTAAAAGGLIPIPFVDAATTRERLVQLGLLGVHPVVVEPIFHLADRRAWEVAGNTGDYPWSSRELSYEAQGFVHCSFRRQQQRVLTTRYHDVDPDDLVLLELDPGLLDAPVVVEDLNAGDAYPHLYGPLTMAAVTDVNPSSTRH